MILESVDFKILKLDFKILKFYIHKNVQQILRIIWRIYVQFLNLLLNKFCCFLQAEELESRKNEEISNGYGLFDYDDSLYHNLIDWGFAKDTDIEDWKVASAAEKVHRCPLIILYNLYRTWHSWQFLITKLDQTTEQF